MPPALVCLLPASLHRLVQSSDEPKIRLQHLDTRNPSVRAVERLAKALDVELHQLLMPSED